MASKISRIDGRGGSRWTGERVSGRVAWEDLPEALHVDRTRAYQAMLDQGLRLNRAFASISDPVVREAIVNLVVEAAEIESARRSSPKSAERPARENGAEYGLSSRRGALSVPRE